MKKYLSVIASVVILAGCGQSEDPAAPESSAAGEATAPEVAVAATAEEVTKGAPGPQPPEGPEVTTSSDEAPASEVSSSPVTATKADASADDDSVAESDNQEASTPMVAIPATTNKKAPIRAAANSGSATVNTVDKGADLSLGSRNGIWYAVQSPFEGWVKITDVTIPTAGGDGSSGLAGLVSGRMGSGNSVASSGARGLDGDAISTGQPDFEAVQELSALQNSGDSLGEKFFDGQEERDITVDEPAN